MFNILCELATFLRARKKFWLFPPLVVMAIFGFLIVITEGTATAAFLYSVF